MEVKSMIPIGVENFEKLRRNDYYYADKTSIISDLLQNRTDVTLFTRPRRFCKSLIMGMLKHFFSVEGDKSIFDGLEISERELLSRRVGRDSVRERGRICRRPSDARTWKPRGLFVVELKYDKNLDKGCRDALDQIGERGYAEELQYEGDGDHLKV